MMDHLASPAERVDLPPALRQSLVAHRRSCRRCAVVCGVAEVVLALLAALVLLAAFDWFLRPDQAVRSVAGTIAAGGVVAIALWRVVWPLVRPMPLDRVARGYERAAGGLDEQVSSAVDFALHGSPPGASAWMVERTLVLAARRVAGFDRETLIDTGPARRAWLRLAVLAVVVLGAGWLLPGVGPLLARAAAPGAAIARPAVTRLTVTPAGDRRLAAGSDLVITATAAPQPERVELLIEWEDGVREVLSMPSAPSGYRRRLPALTRGLRFRVRAGDALSTPVRVALADPPRVVGIELAITPPAYAREATRVVNGGDASVVAGAHVELRARLAGMPVRRASLLCADGTLRPMRLAQGEARVELDLRRDLSYGLRLLGADGLQVDLPQTWQITVRDDAPPRLAVNLPRGTPELVAVDAVLPVACQAHDDIGLEALALELGIGTQAVHRRAIPLAEPTRTHRFTDRLDLGALAPEPGQTLTLCLWARDLGGQEARSEAVPLQIGTAQQAGDQARSQRARALLEHLRRAREALVTVGRGWSRAEQAYLPGDAAIHRGQLKLVAKQQERALARFAAVIDGLAALGVERPAEERSRLEHLGTELDWWRERVGGMLAQAHAAALSASGPAVVPAIERGAQLVTHAIDELDAISQRCALVVALAEARALAARVALAGDRLDVTVQVLRGQVAWAPMRGLPGLHASFHPGRAFVGAPVHTAAAVPRLRDLRVPGLGREDWCALYRGEIYIPEEGTWHFRCTTDDGVQLRIGGAALIGNEAWREQAPTSYRGSEAFTKGWHAIDLRYFQASGGSRLEVSMGREHDQLRPLGSDRLRHFTDTGTATPGLIAAMAQLPQRISDQALSRLQRDGALLTAIPRELARLGADTGSTRLDRLARRSADAGRSLDAWLADRAAGNPDAGDLERFAALAAALQPVPREAALILRTAMVERIPATPRQVTAIASETNIERIDGLCRALRAGGQGSGRHILGAEVDRLASGVARRVRAALDEAADPALSAVQRAAAARAAWVLAVRPAATLATMRRRLRHEPLAVAELRQGCDQLEDDMRRSRTALQELERAAMAEDADVALAALRRTQMAAGASARELARRELRAALATLLPLAVARGAGRLADMQRFVDGALVLDDPAALADRLARWAEGGSGGVGAPASCEQMLDRTAALLGATDAGQRGLGDVLAQRLPVLVELEARRLARRGETQRARACAALSRGLARALSAAGSARERLAVLEAVRSGEPPSGPDQADETTQHLSRLAGSLRELARSGDPASRRALDRALVALAAPAAGPSDAVVAGGLAEELIAAAGRIEEQLAALDATSAEALSTLGRYRTGQQGVAQALAALAERVTRLRDLPTTDAPALSVLAALPATLTRLAERAEALAGADAVSGPADALAPARALARAIAHEAVEPVARAYRRAGAAQGVDAPELSAFGRELAATAADQEALLTVLARPQARRRHHQLRLGTALADAAVLVERVRADAAPPPGPAAQSATRAHTAWAQARHHARRARSELARWREQHARAALTPESERERRKVARAAERAQEAAARWRKETARAGAALDAVVLAADRTLCAERPGADAVSAHHALQLTEAVAALAAELRAQRLPGDDDAHPLAQRVAREQGLRARAVAILRARAAAADGHLRALAARLRRDQPAPVSSATLRIARVAARARIALQADDRLQGGPAAAAAILEAASLGSALNAVLRTAEAAHAGAIADGEPEPGGDAGVSEDGVGASREPEVPAVEDVASAPPGAVGADWARLRARVEQGLLVGGAEYFAAEDRSVIRAYFERLSRERQ